MQLEVWFRDCRRAVDLTQIIGIASIDKRQSLNRRVELQSGWLGTPGTADNLSSLAELEWELTLL